MSKSRSMELRLAPGVRPHNGRDGYRVDVRAKDPHGIWIDPKGKYLVRGLGGQQLLIRRAMQYMRFVAPVGRRFGKTTSIPFLLWEESRHVTGTYYAMVVSASHDKAIEIKEFCENFYGGAVTKSVGGPKDQRRYIEVLPISQPDGKTVTCKGLRIYFVSGAHPHYKRLRGYPHPMHRVIVDEFAQSHPDLRKVVFPMLTDCGGKFLAIGTTDEKEIGNDLFHLYYSWGLDPKRESWGCMNFPTHANPLLSEQGIKEIVSDCVTQDDLDQEVYAKFLQGKGAVFQNLERVFILPYEEEWPDWCHAIQSKAIAARGDNLPDERLAPPDVYVAEHHNPLHTYALSVDWAKDRDHTVISVWNLTTLKQAALFRFYGDTWTEQFVWLSELVKTYKCESVHGDANTGAGQAMHEELRKTYDRGVIEHKFSVYNKPEYVRRGEILFYESRVQMISAVDQYNEFKRYKRFVPDEATGQKHIRYGHPPGFNDDFVDSFLQITETLGFGAVPEKPPHIVKNYNIVDDNGLIDMDAVVDRANKRRRLQELEAQWATGG